MALPMPTTSKVLAEGVKRTKGRGDGKGKERNRRRNQDLLRNDGVRR